MKSATMRKKVASETTLAPQAHQVISPEAVMTEMIESLVRERAYQLYLERGGGDGCAENDWYRAEAEVLQRLNSAAA
ncbi:MAG TPA: DUF2934 domain-containing protein [Terriglobales bacterium]|nr:DUF2934 domain-containing protein [Terriglobales bacterium]